MTAEVMSKLVIGIRGENKNISKLKVEDTMHLLFNCLIGNQYLNKKKSESEIFNSMQNEQIVTCSEIHSLMYNFMGNWSIG